MNKEDSRLEKSAVFSRFLKSWEAGEDLVAAGVPGSAPAYLAAQAFLRHPRPLVVLVSDTQKAERYQSELSSLLARRVALYPAPGEQSSAADDPELVGERLAIASSLIEPGTETPVIVTTPAAWRQPLPDPAGFQERKTEIKTGDRINLDDLLARLVNAGYENHDPVTAPGQFARRGGVVDVFSGQEDFPARIEFFGETVDSLRRFDPLEQRSTDRIDRLTIYPAAVREGEADLGNYVSGACRLVGVDLKDFPTATGGKKGQPPFIALSAMPPPGGDNVNFSISSLEKFKYPGPGVIHPLLEAIPRWLKDGYMVVLYAFNPGEKDRLKEILKEKGVHPHPGLDLRQGELAEGFIWPEADLAAVSDSEIFSRYEIQRPRPRYRGGRAGPEQVRFEEGDHVVHADHGIGLYLGVKTIFSGGKSKQMLAVKYAEGGKLYIPLTQAHLLTRYLGLGRKAPELDRLGGKRWAAAKSKTARAVGRMAAQLLEAQAWRQTLSGHRFNPDTLWQKEFEAAFIYPETPDQSQALKEIKADMESERPMDRLLCGDVGYGKTEVAVRAAFKAVMDGRQVAVMVPTTVLAQQHYYTFFERMADYPIRVEMLSRFIFPANQRKIIEDLARGRVDIVIGTSRLVQKDVRFKSLGLVVIDEEQRFGVKLKERIKQMRLLVDVLTLTATPIPRTLHLSLSGARDLSTINTPPHDRLAVETRVLPYEPEQARQAIAFELQRGGQVYYLHNRVKSIATIRDKIQGWFPDKRVAVGHGQMEESKLAEVMRLFSRGEIDVLVSTTIIESGLDIPNANTIIVENADRFGLADLYQLRGRVGRFKRRAYAYLFYSSWKYLPETAHQRLRAIEEFSHLGAGFSLALRDLEIRGAGNILGQEQHGHIAAVGFDLYCRLLRRSMDRLKGRAVPPEVETRLDFDLGAEIPREYISDDYQRIEMSRKWARIESTEERKEWLAELGDRFGPPPPMVASLAAAADLRMTAKAKGITSISEENGKFIIRRREKIAAVLDPPSTATAERLRFLIMKISRIETPKSLNS